MARLQTELLPLAPLLRVHPGSLNRMSPRPSAETVRGRMPRLGWTRLGWIGATAILLGVVAVSDAFGCPNCKDAVAGADPEAMNLARGYFYSILIMLAMPFALVGSFGAYVWREMRRQQQAGTGVSNPPRP